MRKLLYIMVLSLLTSLSAFALYPSPDGDAYFSSYYSNDGYPELFKISAPVPNPVVDYAQIFYNIPQDKNAEIAIYNFTGAKLHSYIIEGGKGQVDFEAYELQNGVYFVCLIYEGKNIDSKKLIKK